MVRRRGRSRLFHPLAIRAGRIGVTQIGRLLFATTGTARVVPPVCPIFANIALAAMFQQSETAFSSRSQRKYSTSYHRSQGVGFLGAGSARSDPWRIILISLLLVSVCECQPRSQSVVTTGNGWWGPNRLRCSHKMICTPHQKVNSSISHHR
jgi:hypothetical protein